MAFTTSDPMKNPKAVKFRAAQLYGIDQSPPGSDGFYSYFTYAWKIIYLSWCLICGIKMSLCQALLGDQDRNAGNRMR